MIAKGVGGWVELYDDRIRLVRDGFINYLFFLFVGAASRITTTIPLRHIAAFVIVKPFFLNEIVMIAHPGGPPVTGRLMHDAMAENALLMNFFDNRAMYSLIKEAEELMAHLHANKPLKTKQVQL